MRSCRALCTENIAQSNDFPQELIVVFDPQSGLREFGYKLHNRFSMDLLPALRDAEGDLSAWRRSPLKPLIENAFKDMDPHALEEIGDAIKDAATR
jgi:putative ATP-dependent endonuclease of OLD family